MFSALRRRLQPEDESTLTGNRPSSKKSQQEQLIDVNGADVRGLAFLPDGEYFVTGDHLKDGKIRRWRVKDGKEVASVDAGFVINIAVSQDGKWIVNGGWKKVTVWDAEKLKKVREIEGHQDWVRAVDISPDTTRIASGSVDENVCVWSLSTGQRLLGPLKHDNGVAAVKISPDGRLFATATKERNSVRIYDGQDGRLLVDFPLRVTSFINQSIAWKSDSKQLFVLSSEGDIHCLDPYAHTTLSTWRIHGNTYPWCISLASDGSFIATSNDSSVSFWDTTTHQQIGSVIDYRERIGCMALSANYDFVTGGESKIILRNLLDILPSPYCDQIFNARLARTEPDLFQTFQSFHQRSKQNITNLEKTVQQLQSQLADSQSNAKRKEESLNDRYTILEKTVQELRIQLADSQSTAKRNEGDLDDAIKRSTILEKSVQQLQNQLADSQTMAKRKEDSLNDAIRSIQAQSDATVTQLRTQQHKADDLLSVYRQKHRCESLYASGHVIEAAHILLESMGTATDVIKADKLIMDWLSGFQRRCMKTLEQSANVAMGSQNYNEAAEYFSAILSFDTADQVDILIKRSKARVMMNSWGEALEDADEAIKLDPSSPRGYEQRHATLHGAGRYSEAVEAFDTMLSKLDPELRDRYIDPRHEIRRIIDATVSRMPLVLIDTTTGRLCDRSQIPNVFETLPLFTEFVSSSMTTELDDTRVQREVSKFYEYVMFSHRWQYGEPLFQDVECISVYELQLSPTNSKLKKFCSTARSRGFRWAWSDTCCIDKRDKVVLEESLVAMFKWYRGSSLTLVHLLGVLSQSNKVGLKNSIWNERAWTYQEYLAADKVVFYTEDWELYLGLTLSNHKYSPIVLLEMEQATGQSHILQPGLDKVREKLFLASSRKSTCEEDIAYSLFGIFNVAIPVIYGEGNRAVGRLLEHILTGSGDVTVMAWTGAPNGYNSCLPSDLTVYDQLVPPHLPLPMTTVEVDRIVTELESSTPDLSLFLKLYDHLYALPLPSLASSRLRLAGIVFRINEIIPISGPDLKTRTCVYHAITAALGEVEIKTMDNLMEIKALYLVHPWIRPLLDCDHEFSRAPPKRTRALRLFARLMQPFGALLFEQVSRVEYKRVAADSLSMVQVAKDVSLNELIDNVTTIDVQ